MVVYENSSLNEPQNWHQAIGYMSEKSDSLAFAGISSIGVHLRIHTLENNDVKLSNDYRFLRET